MELSDLRIFRAVVQEGGVTRAAMKLNRVQSNVTTRVRQLEERLGVSLFRREGKRLQLTPAGHTLLDYAERLLRLAAEAEAALHDDAPRGLFRLGAMESTAAVRLPAPLAAFSQRYPDVELALTTGNPTQLAQALLAGDIDAALVAEPVAEAQFEAQVAFTEVPVIVTAENQPPVDKAGDMPPTMIVFEEGCPHRARLEAWYRRQGVQPRNKIELRSYHAMLGCVLAGMGAALLPESVLTTFPESGRLRVHRLPRDEVSLRTLLIWRKGLCPPNVKALAAILAVPALAEPDERRRQRN
jgi:DNA-binding transcriptional LysR family regulator